MELSLISFISLLSVCLAALLIKKVMHHNEHIRRYSSISLRVCRSVFTLAAVVAGLALYASPTFAQSREGGETNLILPDLSRVTFFGGIDGHRLLLFGILICVLGLGFGMAIYMKLKKLPVHRAMREISELIYETCKT